MSNDQKHTQHCLARQKWGDGECGCHVKNPKRVREPVTVEGEDLLVVRMALLVLSQDDSVRQMSAQERNRLLRLQREFELATGL